MTYSPVVDAQVGVILQEPLATQCAAWLASPPTTPTKGPLFSTFEWDHAPDYIPVAGESDDIPGYISKYDLFCNVCDGPKVVLDESLQHVVGHMVPGKGFVPAR